MEAGRLFDNRLPTRIADNPGERFHNRLSVHHFQLMRRVRQDIHKTFRILSQLIFGRQKFYRLMRTCLFSEINANRKYYASRYKGNDFDGFLNQLRDESVGEDSLCILAACELFHVTVREMYDDDFVIFTEIAPVKRRENERNPFYRKMIWSSYTQEHGYRLIRPQTPADDDIIDPGFQVKLSWLLENFENPENQAQLIENCENFLNHLPTKVSPKGQYRRHSLRIREWGFKRVPILGDGNCMFRSLSFHMAHTQHKHLKTRHMVTAKLKTNPDRYSKLCEYEEHPTEDREESYDEYLERMAIPGTWGDGACMQAAADMCHIKITVLDADFLLFHEFVPIGNHYRKEIHCCQNSHHMDVLLPLENLQQEVDENPFFDQNVDTFGLNSLFEKVVMVSHVDEDSDFNDSHGDGLKSTAEPSLHDLHVNNDTTHVPPMPDSLKT